MSTSDNGLVLVSQDPIEVELVTSLRKLGPYEQVEVGYLTDQGPSLRKVIGRLVAAGIDRITLIPVLTANRSGQFESRLADELARGQREHPQVEFNLVQATLEPELHAQLLLAALQQDLCGETEENSVPLSALSTAESGTVQGLNGGHDLVSRLSALGFVPGSPLEIVQNYEVGPLIVSVQGTQIALGREEARRVRVCRAVKRRPRRHARWYKGQRRRHWAKRRHE